MDIDVVYELDGGELNSNNLLAGESTSTRDITYALVGEAGARIVLNISATDYKMTATLLDKDGNTISTSNVIDLPLESMVVSGSYDSTTKKVILTLQNGNTVEFSIADLVDGLVSFTDYASTSKGGVIKVSDANATGVGSAGNLMALKRSYSEYENGSDYMFIGKGTLENIITGKGLVSNTNYASNDKGGVIKLRSDYATNVYNGALYASTKTYEEYTSLNNGGFIGKGTLENVLTARIGDIEEALQSI